jgi:hypothetical protein
VKLLAQALCDATKASEIAFPEGVGGFDQARFIWIFPPAGNDNVRPVFEFSREGRMTADAVCERLRGWMPGVMEGTDSCAMPCFWTAPQLQRSV